MNIKAIFFDTNDTLYHSPEFEDAQSKHPIVQLSQVKGISFEEAKVLFKEIKESLKGKTSHVTKVAVMMELGIDRTDMQESLATNLEAKDYLHSDERLNKILQRLSGKYKLGIITNVLEKFLDDILNALSIDKKYFSHIVSVDNTKNSKPYEEPFLKAIELAGCNPEECVYVGDSVTKDMVPAKKVGMKTIWISKGCELEEKNVVDVCVDSIYYITSALDKIN